VVSYKLGFGNWKRVGAVLGLVCAEFLISKFPLYIVWELTWLVGVTCEKSYYLSQEVQVDVDLAGSQCVLRTPLFSFLFFLCLLTEVSFY